MVLKGYGLSFKLNVWKLKSRVRNIIFNLSLNLDEKKVSPYCHKTFRVQILFSCSKIIQSEPYIYLIRCFF